MLNTGKHIYLNDPNKQREMLANRSISGVYKWSDGKHETTYTGSYELDFLKTLDNFFDWDPRRYFYAISSYIYL